MAKVDSVSGIRGLPVRGPRLEREEPEGKELLIIRLLIIRLDSRFAQNYSNVHSYSRLVED
jgi:hypothetical protein